MQNKQSSCRTGQVGTGANSRDELAVGRAPWKSYGPEYIHKGDMWIFKYSFPTDLVIFMVCIIVNSLKKNTGDNIV